MNDNRKRLIVYLALTFVLSWIFMFGVVWRTVDDQALYTAAAAACMFFPALCVVLTRLITREGFHDTLLRPRLRGNLRWYLLAYFGPGVLVLLGAALYFLVLPGRLDPEAGYFRQIMAASGMPYEAQAVPLGILLSAQLLQALLLGGIINLIPSLGEEWGWRGYMMPKLIEEFGAVPAILMGGVIWGLWHEPLIALGHNYGTGYPGWPWLGIGAMCVFCVAFGTFLTYLTVKTGSCIPAAVAHGAFNAIAGIGMLLTADGGEPFLGPAPTGVVGGFPILLLAVLLLLRFRKGTVSMPEYDP